MDTIDIITISISAIIFLVFIYYTRKTSTFKQFAVSNNSIGLLFISCSFAATFIGPGFSMALVREGFENGFFYLIIASFYGLAKIIEGTFVAGKLRVKFHDALSIGDIVAGPHSGNNNILRLAVGIISFALVVGFGTVLAKAGGEILNGFFGLPPMTGIIIITSIVVVYSFFGGIKATILTDVFQFFFFVVIIAILFITILNIGELDISAFTDEAFKSTRLAIEQTSLIKISGLLVAWFFGEMLIPPTINRILASKDSKVSRKGLVFSGVFMIVWLAIMLFIGIAGSLVLDVEASDQILLKLGQNYLHYGLFGIFIVAVLGIVMSSLDSLINSASVIITKDIFGIFKQFDDNSNLVLAKVSTIIVGVFSVLFATYLPSILEGLLFVYSLWAPAMLVPIFSSVFLNKNYWQASLVSMITGIIGSLMTQFFITNSFFPPIINGIITSVVGFVIIYYFYKFRDDKK